MSISSKEFAKEKIAIILALALLFYIVPKNYIVNNDTAKVYRLGANLYVKNIDQEKDLVLILEKDGYKNTYIIDKGDSKAIAIPYDRGEYKVTTALLEDNNTIINKEEKVKTIKDSRYADIEELINKNVRRYYYHRYDNRLEKIVIKGSDSKLEFTDKVYEYVRDNIEYDFELANEITSNNIVKYRLSLDRILEEKSGICLDYASLMASILMTKEIKARVKVGFNANNEYHAWVSVYINKQWLDYDPTLGLKYTDDEMKEYKVQGIY